MKLTNGVSQHRGARRHDTHSEGKKWVGRPIKLGRIASRMALALLASVWAGCLKTIHVSPIHRNGERQMVHESRADSLRHAIDALREEVGNWREAHRQVSRQATDAKKRADGISGRLKAAIDSMNSQIAAMEKILPRLVKEDAARKSAIRFETEVENSSLSDGRLRDIVAIGMNRRILQTLERRFQRYNEDMPRLARIFGLKDINIAYGFIMGESSGKIKSTRRDAEYVSYGPLHILDASAPRLLRLVNGKITKLDAEGNHEDAAYLRKILKMNAGIYGNSLFVPKKNLALGLAYIELLMEEFQSLPLAAYGYNSGEDRVRQAMARSGYYPKKSVQHAQKICLYADFFAALGFADLLSGRITLDEAAGRAKNFAGIVEGGDTIGNLRLKWGSVESGVDAKRMLVADNYRRH